MILIDVKETRRQGKNNRLLFPTHAVDTEERGGRIDCRSRLGGKLKYYHRERPLDNSGWKIAEK